MKLAIGVPQSSSGPSSKAHPSSSPGLDVSLEKTKRQPALRAHCNLKFSKAVCTPLRRCTNRQLVVRRSSDVLAVNDPVVSSALKIIQREACTGLNVEKLLDQMTISRATLERRFERFLGRSPKDEILRLRLNRVRERLADSEDTLAQIVDATGFSSVSHLSVAFKQATSLSPGEFRRRHQSAARQR